MLALSDGALIALIPVAGVIAGGLLVGLFGLANRHASAADAARQELLAIKDQRILLLTVERDEARKDLDLCRTERDEYREQVAGLESTVAKVRPVRGVRRP